MTFDVSNIVLVGLCILILKSPEGRITRKDISGVITSYIFPTFDYVSFYTFPSLKKRDLVIMHNCGHSVSIQGKPWGFSKG